MYVVLTYSDNILGGSTGTPRGKKEIKGKTQENPRNRTCSGSAVKGFGWLYTGNGFRQREICMAEWRILEEGAHKQRYCIYTHTCP